MAHLSNVFKIKLNKKNKIFLCFVLICFFVSSCLDQDQISPKKKPDTAGNISASYDVQSSFSVPKGATPPTWTARFTLDSGNAPVTISLSGVNSPWSTSSASCSIQTTNGSCSIVISLSTTTASRGTLSLSASASQGDISAQPRSISYEVSDDTPPPSDGVVSISADKTNLNDSPLGQSSSVTITYKNNSANPVLYFSAQTRDTPIDTVIWNKDVRGDGCGSTLNSNTSCSVRYLYTPQIPSTSGTISFLASYNDGKKSTTTPSMAIPFSSGNTPFQLKQKWDVSLGNQSIYATSFFLSNGIGQIAAADGSGNSIQVQDKNPPTYSIFNNKIPADILGYLSFSKTIHSSGTDYSAFGSFNSPYVFIFNHTQKNGTAFKSSSTIATLSEQQGTFYLGGNFDSKGNGIYSIDLTKNTPTTTSIYANNQNAPVTTNTIVLGSVSSGLTYYFGSQDGNFFKWDGNTLKQLPVGSSSAPPMYAVLSPDQKTIYVGIIGTTGFPSSIKAIDISNGAFNLKSWTYTTPVSDVLTNFTIGQDGTLYLGTGVSVYAVKENGANNPLWEFHNDNTTHPLLLPLIQIDQNQNLWLTNISPNGPNLYVLNSSGYLIQNFSTTPKANTTSRVAFNDTQDTAYIGMDNGHLYAITNPLVSPLNDIQISVQNQDNSTNDVTHPAVASLLSDHAITLNITKQAGLLSDISDIQFSLKSQDQSSWYFDSKKGAKCPNDSDTSTFPCTIILHYLPSTDADSPTVSQLQLGVKYTISSKSGLSQTISTTMPAAYYQQKKSLLWQAPIATQNPYNGPTVSSDGSMLFIATPSEIKKVTNASSNKPEINTFDSIKASTLTTIQPLLAVDQSSQKEILYYSKLQPQGSLACRWAADPQASPAPSCNGKLQTWNQIYYNMTQDNGSIIIPYLNAYAIYNDKNDPVFSHSNLTNFSIYGDPIADKSILYFVGMAPSTTPPYSLLAVDTTKKTDTNYPLTFDAHTNPPTFSKDKKRLYLLTGTQGTSTTIPMPGMLYAISSGAKPSVIWNSPTDQRFMIGVASNTVETYFVQRPVEGQNSVIYFGDSQGTFYAYKPDDAKNPTSWTLAWKWTAPLLPDGKTKDPLVSIPAIAQDKDGNDAVIYIGASKGVYALQLNENTTPSQVRFFPTGSIVFQPVYDSNTGNLYVMASNGTLYALQTRL